MAEFEKPPKEDVFRAFAEPMELRDGMDMPSETGDLVEGQEETGNTLRGHFAVFNSPTIIDSYYEGRFCEIVAPGAFAKTFVESRDSIRVLLSHGFDPTIGDKPIATITDLREDETGAYYECELLDGLDPLVVAGLRAGQYGASFRFRVMREEWDEKPGPSESNPDGLPLRTLKEVQVREVGPTTFGAYSGATSEVCAAGMRMLEPMGSLADEVIVERLAQDPARLTRLVEERSAHMAAFSKAMDEVRAGMGPGAGMSEDGDAAVGILQGAITHLTNYAATEPEADDVTTVNGVIDTLTTLLNKEVAEPRSATIPELDAPADGTGKEPESDARREQEPQEATAPPESDDTDDGTQTVTRDYLSGDVPKPDWYLP